MSHEYVVGSQQARERSTSRCEAPRASRQPQVLVGKFPRFSFDVRRHAAFPSGARIRSKATTINYQRPRTADEYAGMLVVALMAAVHDL